MPISTSCIYSLNRGLWGAGFILAGCLAPAYAQRGPELSLSGGAVLSRAALTRHNLPDNFRTVPGFSSGAALRLTLPVRPWLGLGLEQRITGLAQQFTYRFENGRLGSGIGSKTLYQYGVRAVLYDLWLPGPRWALDVALTGTYALPLHGSYHYTGPLWHTAADTRPTPTRPLIAVTETQSGGTPMAGLEALLRYELSPRQVLLLTATYQRGLRRFSEIRSTQADFLDAAGTVRQGSFVASTRGSYATVQLGYGLRLGATETSRLPTPRTPRYGAAPDEEQPLSEPETNK
ncbi:hypothetical protein GCM10022408_17610 [Hymenobacter fastidiosus]|uniref:Outer membrane protein beta-barrel domain-containing protein n=1 Tax=Hymenobacter fastidiosus TaxID=486264 RepID=A0ABP7S3W3_9BACT